MRKIATIVYSRAADAQLSRLRASVRDVIESALDNLAMRLDDFPHQRLTGINGFKLRVGDYRVIYRFDPREPRIDVGAVGHRREIYERIL